MEAEDYKFFTEQNQNLQRNLEGYMDRTIIAQATVISERVDRKIEQKMGDTNRKLDQIITQDIIRNGRIGHNEDNIEGLQKETSVPRWAHRNPYLFLIGFLIIFFGLAYGYHRINVVKTIANTTGLVIEGE